MKNHNKYLKKYNLSARGYRLNGKAIIIDTGESKYVIKPINDLKIYDTYNYLLSRNFNYFPSIISTKEDDVLILEYIDSINIPDEQKILDLIDLVSLLHYKTTIYKEVDLDDYKKIYEDINSNIIYLYSYYSDLITIIESKVFMSPAEYLLARNISIINSSLDYSKNELEKWYELVKEKRKQRQVVLHNNLSIDHFLRTDKPYLISFDKSRIDSPIYDIYKLYKKHSLLFDFEDLFIRYEKNYPLLEDERKLLFILISLPDKIIFDDTNYNICEAISKSIDTLYKSSSIISKYYSRKKENNTKNEKT